MFFVTSPRCSASGRHQNAKTRSRTAGNFTILLLLLHLPLSAGVIRAQEVEWIHEFRSVRPGDEVAQAVDADCNVYVAGFTDGSHSALPGQTSAGSFDAFVRKYDASGNEVWTRQFGTPAFDQPLGVAADPTGVYVAGITAGTFPGQTSAGGFTDAFVRKYDLNGNEVWTRQFGTASDDRAAAVAADGSGGVYVAGFTPGAFPGQTNAGSIDAFVRKYDATTGDELWTDQFGTSSFDQALSVATDVSGVYVAGLTGGDLARPNLGSGDAFVRKYDATTGAAIWTDQFGTSSFEAAFSVDALGDVYVAGNTTGSFPGETGSGRLDAFVRKYDVGGNEVWTRQFGPVSGARGIAASSSGAYVVGFTAFAFGLPGQTSLGQTDAFVRKYDVGGNEVWTRQFGTPDRDAANGVAVDPLGDVYVAGYVGLISPPSGSQDAFVRKYNSSGIELWNRQFGGVGTGRDNATAVAAADGNAYVAGTAGALPGQTNAGPFVAKYDAAGNEVWTSQFTTGGTQGSAFGISVGLSGGVYVVGAGSGDAFVRKHDATTGDELWTDQFGTPRGEIAFSVATDVSGVYAVGSTRGDLARPNLGSKDAFVRKYDATTGAAIWTDQFGTSSLEQGFAIAVNPSEVPVGIYAAGITSGEFLGQTSAGGFDVFVRKYDASGAHVWTRQFGTPDFDSTHGIAADASGIYLAGGTTGAFLAEGQTSAGSGDAFVRKYDVSGNHLWTRQFGTSGFDEALGVSLDVLGVYVAGYTDGTFPGETSANLADAFVSTYDAAGNQICTRQLSFSSPGFEDWAQGISVDSSGVYLVGPVSPPVGPRDAFLAKLIRDFDCDGIADNIDTAPAAFSNDFSDIPNGGTTAGTITDRGNQLLTVRDSTAPPPDDGVMVTADPSGGALPATITACGGASNYTVIAGQTQFIATCGSSRTTVIAGSVEIALTSSDGRAATTTVDAGNSIVFEPTTFTITSSPTNSSNVVVLIEGFEFLLGPDRTLKAVEIDIKPGSDPNCFNNDGHGVIPVAILGSGHFDVTQVDPATVKLESLSIKVVGNGNILANVEDVNSDGFADLVVKIEDSDTVLLEGQDRAVLTGELFDGTLITGMDSICIVPSNGAGAGGAIEVARVLFLRGDSNRDGTVDISDAVANLNYLFSGGTAPTCQDAADANDDGKLGMSDAVYTLFFLFSGGPVIPEPYPQPGLDPTSDHLGCE